MATRPASFVEVCIYEVRADRTDEFEELVHRVAEHHRSHPGVIDVRYMKRTHRQDDFNAIRDGKPARPLVRRGKAVTYVLYWELDDEVVHGAATKSGLGLFYGQFRRCLLSAPRILLGTRLA